MNSSELSEKLRHIMSGVLYAEMGYAEIENIDEGIAQVQALINTAPEESNRALLERIKSDQSQRYHWINPKDDIATMIDNELAALTPKYKEPTNAN